MTAVHEPITTGSHHTPNKPRIAVLSYHTSPLAEIGGPEVGGMNVYVRELCQALGSRGFALDVFTRRSSPVAPDVQPFGPNVRVIDIDAGPPTRIDKDDLPRYIETFTRAVATHAEKERMSYAMVASHYWMSGVAGIDLAERWHVPHVAMFHTLGEVKNRARETEHESAERIAAERSIMESVEAIVVASPHERVLLSEHYGASPERVIDVPLGVDLELFTPVPKSRARSQLGLKHGEAILLFVGRIEPLKGIDLLIAAAAQLEQRDNVRVLIIGGDASAMPEIATLREQAKGLGIYSRVSFLGAVDHAQLPLYYSAADVTVVPSFYESFGLVAVESMACGTPVVASNVGGLATTVIDGETGYLVSPLTPEGFAWAIDKLLADNQLRDAFGQAGHRAVERYGWPSVADEVAVLYQQLLHEHAALPFGV